MYQNIFIDRKSQVIHVWDDEVGHVELPLSDARYAYRKKEGGGYRSIYGDSLERIYRFNPRDPSLFESDVPLDTRVLIDMYEESDDMSSGHRIMFYDIETSSEGGFPDMETADKELTAIALYDTKYNKYTAYILDKEGKLSDSLSDEKDVISCPDEKSLILAFLEKYTDISPTIITGWNIDGFDNPYLYRRIKRILGEGHAMRLSPINICYINDWNGKLIIAGVSSLDYITLYKKYNVKTEPTYNLDYIGKKTVNRGKVEFTGDLNKLFNDDIEKYIEYNLNDVIIVHEIDKKLQFIEQARQICHKGHVPYECFSKSSRFIEGAILMYLRRKGKVAKNKPIIETQEEFIAENSDEDKVGFEGAYVKKPVPGRYDWVFDLDLTSMYPNIIISLNISPETKVAVVDRIEYDSCYVDERTADLRIDYDNLSKQAKSKTPFSQYLDERLYKFNTKLFFQKKIDVYHIGSATYTHDELIKFLKQSNYSIASNGAIYNQDFVGVIPEILTNWFNERKELRKLAKKHGDAKEWDLYNKYDRLQKTVKIQLNSIYGVTGLPIFRFYDKDNASAVTLTGQTIIKSTDLAVNQYFKRTLNDTSNDKDYVLYVDTDSIFSSALPLIIYKNPNVDVTDEDIMTKEILSETSKVQEYVNEFYHVMAKKFFNLDKHRFDIKQEVIAKTAFWLAKKRYVQYIINNGGVAVPEEDSMEIKGLDVVRTNFPQSFRDFMSIFLENLLKKVDMNDIDEMILDFQEKVNSIDIINIAKNTSVKFIGKGNKNYDPDHRHPFRYIRGTPAQVKSALYYNDLINHLGLSNIAQPIYNGQKIKWVYLKSNPYHIDCIALKADDTDPQQILDFIEKYIDKSKMYNKELKKKLLDFYTVLNHEFPSTNSKILNQFFSF